MEEKGSRPRRANELGPIGTQVAANVYDLRRERGLTTEQLAERMTAQGRPMLANTITKIEKGQRRVDADDLVALSLALEARPDRLLLRFSGIGDMQLTDATTVPAWKAWRWANGQQPLATPADDDGRYLYAWLARVNPPGLAEFRNRPEDLKGVTWFGPAQAAEKSVEPGEG